MPDWHRWAPYGEYIDFKRIVDRTSLRRPTQRTRLRAVAWLKWPAFGDTCSALLGSRLASASASKIKLRDRLISADNRKHVIRQPQSTAKQLLDMVQCGKILPTGLTVSQLKAIQRWCLSRSNASQAELQRLVDLGHHKNAKRLRIKHLNSREVLLHALFCAARRQWKVGSEMTQERAGALRRRRLIKPFEQLHNVGRFARCAKARLKHVRKEGGGTRPIMSFQWVDRARQIALKSAITPFANLHDGQFMLSHDPERRGPAAVREALLTALTDCGDDSLFMHFDIRDFYGSISHEWLEGKLGIDPSIVRRQIHKAEMLIVPMEVTMVVRGPHEANTVEKSRRGIPQGSSLSPLIAEITMAEVLRGVAALSGLPIFVWSDNLGVIVPRDRAGNIEKLVRDAFAQHSAGPFQIVMVDRRPVAREFKFLGSWYQKSPEGPKVYVPEPVAASWQLSIGARLMVSKPDEIDQIEEYVRQKLGAWRWWSGVGQLERSVRKMIASAREGSIYQQTRAAPTSRIMPRLQPDAID